MGRKVGMNDMWDAMCHEERKKKCSTPRYVFSTKISILHQNENLFGGRGEKKGKKKKEKKRENKKKRKKKDNGKEREPAVL